MLQTPTSLLLVASSGNCGQLFRGGRTAHLVFKLPVKLEQAESATCNIKVCKTYVSSQTPMGGFGCSSLREIFNEIEKHSLTTNNEINCLMTQLPLLMITYAMSLVMGKSIVAPTNNIVDHIPNLIGATILTGSAKGENALFHVYLSNQQNCHFTLNGDNFRDQAIFDIQQERRNVDNRNEVLSYQAGRYISSNEAVWRLFSFALHERYPSVTHLAVHLENGQRSLILIEDKIILMVGKDFRELGIPRPVRMQNVSNVLSREFSYDIDAINAEIAEKMPKLLPEQKEVFEKILAQIDRDNGGIFFLDAPGGTGKTFLLNLLLKIRKDSNIAIAVASSGIAATLLSGGRTAHLVFKLPVKLEQAESATCNISKNSNLGAFLQKCNLLVSLQDIRSSQTPMGGLVVLLAGDFRQTLPVVSRGTPADEINNEIEKLSLTTNMRVKLFNDTASDVNDVNDENLFKPTFCNLISSEEELISKIYPAINDNLCNDAWLWERALLAPTNNILCNGTRLRITHHSPNLIGATILTGSAKGENAFIPRIPIKPTELPFHFKR
ncbi:ATP-dependent DNA helicase pif1 [Lucilia cuprina]|nr:ATP-dependent DNA helicase pif1 [Lucilia cuprina]